MTIPDDVSPHPAPSNPGGVSTWHLTTILPVVIICLVLAVITCVVVSYYARRKNRRARRRPDPALTSISGSIGEEIVNTFWTI